VRNATRPNDKEVAALSAMVQESAVVIPSVAKGIGRRDNDSLAEERRRMPQCRCLVRRVIH
jgi:hypothetical protein